MSSVDILVPDLPESVADATVATWHKKPGDTVSRDDVLVEIETDKVVLEVPAAADGVLDAVLEDEGATVTSRQILGRLKEGNSGGKASDAKAQEKDSTPAQRHSASLEEQSNDALSPAIRRLLAEHGLDARAMKGTGVGGRLTREDVEKHLAAQDKAPATQPAAVASVQAGNRSEKRVPMTRLRKRVAERLLEAKNSTAMLTTFNEVNMRMEMVSFSELVLNPVAQVKFVHTVASGYVTGTMFILGISAWYMLKGRDFAFAKRSFAIAASFGMAAVLSVIVLGDESGYEMGDVQKTKLAAIEAEWETQPAPASFTLFGIPDQDKQQNHFQIQIPYALGLIATRSVDKQVTGLKDLMVQHEARIRNGMKAYHLLEQLRGGAKDPALREDFNQVKKDLGYGLLLKRYTSNVTDATEAQIQQATKDSVPRVLPLYFAFRIMVACGFLLLLIIAASFWTVLRNRVGEKKWLLRAALFGIPLPWIAIESGWFVAEYGRQPWAIGEVLPTAVANSTLTAGDLIFSMLLICGLYTLFLVAELYLMFKFARLGPSSLKTGRYHFEQSGTASQPLR